MAAPITAASGQPSCADSCKTFHSRARQSSLELTLPLRPWLATDTHRSRSPDDLRLTDFCRRSNPHSAAPLLILISTSPRFPPWRLVQHLPPSLTGLGQLSAQRQLSDNPNRFCWWRLSAPEQGNFLVGYLILRRRRIPLVRAETPIAEVQAPMTWRPVSGIVLVQC
jgi:hypothetical protein